MSSGYGGGPRRPRRPSDAQMLARTTLELEAARARLAALTAGLESMAGAWMDRAAALRGDWPASKGAQTGADTLIECARQVKATLAGGEVARDGQV